MIEIRFHGRGGQGSVTAAEILAKAAFKDGKYVQSNIAEEFKGSGEHPVHSIDATGIALDLLGRNIVNTIILGYFAKKTNVVSIESLIEVIKETFPGKVGELNAEATKKAYDMG